MRISDWSSDVCSSDLDQVPAAAWPYGRESFAGPLQSGFRPVHQESRNRRAVAPGESNSAPTDLPDSRDAPVQPATGLQRSRRAHRKFPGSGQCGRLPSPRRSEEHTSELQSLMRISYAVFCLKKQKTTIQTDKDKK